MSGLLRKTRKGLYFFIVLTILSFCFFLSACGNNSDALIEKIDNATINGMEISMLVSPDTQEVYLSDKITCSKNSTWALYSDNLGQMEIPTKIASGENGVLNDGDNIFYIVVNSNDGTKTNTYRLTIHRSYLVQIYYYDNYVLLKKDFTYTGKEYIVNYTPNLVGYSFNGWKTSDGKSRSSIIPWQTTYFYVDKTSDEFTTTLDVNGGHSLVTNSYNLLYGESGILPIPKRDHYDFLGWYAENYQFTNQNGVIVCDWSIEPPEVLIAKWVIEKHTLTLQNAIENAGILIGEGEYDYNSPVEIKAIPKNGYTFKGWYNGDEIISTEQNYSFTIIKNLSLTAEWENYTVTTATNNESGGVYTNFLNNKITCGEKVSISAQTNRGYVWNGWYNINNELVCKDLSFTFIMSKKDEMYIAKWEIDTSMLNFQFSSTVNTCEIISVLDKSVTQIIVPDYVTNIKEGAFNGCGQLECLTLPFVGEGINNTGITKKTLFGYIFGDMIFDGAIATTQRYYNKAEKIYYIPQSLKSVSITNEDCIFYGAFYNCSNIKNLFLSNSLTKIEEYSFYGCGSLETITIPHHVTFIGMFSFIDCKSLTSIIFENTENWTKQGGLEDGDVVDVSNSQNNASLFVGVSGNNYNIGFNLLKKY